ncbi:MAG: hypothetical protein WC979_02250 [Candidatus Pacearchaeota archaeon]|jgi:hypothetical protein|nr:hypothetical protein [Clostridia bacterium]
MAIKNKAVLISNFNQTEVIELNKLFEEGWVFVAEIAQRQSYTQSYGNWTKNIVILEKNQ